MGKGRSITESMQADKALRREAGANAFRIALSDTIRPLESSGEIQREAVQLIAQYFHVQRVNFAIVRPQRDSVFVEEEYANHGPSAIGEHAIASYGKSLTQEPGRILIIENVATDDRLTSDEKAAYQHFKIASAVLVRLLDKGHTAAVFMLAGTQVRKWADSELALIDEAAERVWAAIERAHAERELRRSEERYRLMGRATNDVIWDWSLETGTVQWNDAVLSLFGYTHEALGSIEASWHMRLHMDDRERVIAGLHRTISSGRDTWSDEYRFRKSDGSYATVLDRGHIARDSCGRPYRMIGSVLNVTESRRAEEELRAANSKLVESDRRKDEFLAMLAHELRNPLAALQSVAQLLGMTAADARSQDYMAILRRQTHTLARLVDDLLDVSRVTRGLIVLKRDRVDLAAVVSRALESVHSLLETKRHEAKVTLARTPLAVFGDAVRLEQIVVNLLTNAAKYTDPGGEIAVSIGLRDGQAEIRVRDNGIGIAPDTQEHIFALFGQVAPGLDRSQGGLGIGLTIVKYLTELHGGRVEVHSAGLYQGSEFAVVLPLFLAENTAHQATPQALARNPRAKRILLVEDRPDVADTLALLLGEAGHLVRVVYSGPSALEQAEEFAPDLVLLDIGLPGMNGHEVARRLRQLPCTKNVVLAALTGYGHESDRKLTAAAGFDAHFVKPVNLEVLQTFVNSIAPAAAKQSEGKTNSPMADPTN